MQEDDIGIMQRIAAKEKVRYDELDLKFNNEKNDIFGTVCYVAIDFTSVLADLDAFKEGLVDEKDYDLHVAIELLNCIGHYKHYFQTRSAEHVIVICFVRDGYIYDKYKSILDLFYEFTNFFPNVYFIPNIMERKSSLTIHIVAAILNHIHSISPAAKTKHTSIFVMSSAGVNRQLMYLFPTKLAYTIYKGFGFSATVFLNKEDCLKKIIKSDDNYVGFTHKAELEYMNVLIGKYLNSVKFKSKFDSVKIDYTHSRIKDKINIINDFIENNYDPNKGFPICQQFILYLQSSGEIKTEDELNALTKYESQFDFRYQNLNQLNEVLVPLFDTWKKKIKDYTIARQSENFNILRSHMAYINWLM